MSGWAVCVYQSILGVLSLYQHMVDSVYDDLEEHQMSVGLLIITNSERT